MMSSPITLLTLPSELIEAILISSCSPRTVASVAQTCRTLHTLVYTSPDTHLWRELFLTTWDDPRPALEHRALVDPRIHPASWDWGIEYRRRVSADRWLKAWRRDICLPDDDNTVKETDSEWRTTALSALTAVLDTLLTFRPFPASPPIALTVLTPATISPYPTGNIESGVGNRRERMTNAPPLPPLLIVLASGITAFEASRSGVRVGRMVYGPHSSRVLGDVGPGTGPANRPGTANAERAAAPIPTPSLPPQLVRTLLASHAIGVRGLPAYHPFLSSAGHWGGDPLGDVFYRIVCITGFVAIPPPLASTPTLAHSPANAVESVSDDSGGSASADMEVLKDQQDNAGSEDNSELGTHGDGEQHEKDHREPDEQPMRQSSKPFPTPSQQHANARVVARRRVYDMQYLRGDRLWGPYHIVTRVPPEARPGSSRLTNGGKGQSQEGREHASWRGGARRIGALAWAMGADIELEQLDSNSTSDDSKDEDWHDPADPGQAYSATTADADIDVDVEPVEPEHPLISLILASTNTTDAADIDPITNTASTTTRRRTRRSNPRLPSNCSVSPREIKSHHLRPDYVYLASARIVVEANLRELFENEIGDDVERTMSEVRPGGVGMFWEDEDAILQAGAWSSEPVSSSYVSSSLATVPRTDSATSINSNTFELADILSRFKDLEVARLGSACGYWGGWIEQQQSMKRSINVDADLSASSSDSDVGVRKSRVVAERAQLENPIKDTPAAEGKGKEKEKDESIVAGPSAGLGDWEIGPEGEACEGWDWAGVTGIWKRCVCWMDYRELLFFNLDSSKFLTLDTQEACRIIPMELRITGYSRAGLIPVYDIDKCNNINVLLPDNKRHKTGICTGYFRPPPVIHFTGTSIGSDRGMDDGRKVRGSVQLIGGGEVRWQMDTYTQQSELSALSSPEWSSEAVQVGGIGSAVGVLGMWTGAGHERADPLGPFWAWKVA